MSRTPTKAKKWTAIVLAVIVFLGVAALIYTYGIKPGGSYYRRLRSGGYTDYDRYMSCLGQGGYWLDGMCSTVSLPGSDSLQPTIPYLPGYYNNYPYYYFPSYQRRHQYYPRRNNRRRYWGG